MALAALAASPSTGDAPPVPPRLGALGWLRHHFFRTWWHTVLTVLAAWAALRLLMPLLDWGVWRARLGSRPQDCADATGACWAFVVDMWPFFLVGSYPPAERWRPLVCLIVVLALAGMTLLPRLRRRRALWLAWGVAPVVLLMLLHGTAFGLPRVETSAWGGLLLTLVLSVLGIAFAFPLGVLLALGRRSRRMRVVRALSIGVIELFRGVPLISVLFLASVLVPLFLPSGVTVDNLWRAQVGIIVFQGAYLAEVVRGGLQAVPHGQEEAAMALGLGYGRTMALVVLPQALRHVVPALVNQFIIILKDTSLVAVVGMYDLMGVAEAAVRGASWLGRVFEAYAVVALLYWVMCFAMSRLSLRLERRFGRAGA